MNPKNHVDSCPLQSYHTDPEDRRPSPPHAGFRPAARNYSTGSPASTWSSNTGVRNFNMTNTTVNGYSEYSFSNSLGFKFDRLSLSDEPDPLSTAAPPPRGSDTINPHIRNIWNNGRVGFSRENPQATNLNDDVQRIRAQSELGLFTQFPNYQFSVNPNFTQLSDLNLGNLRNSSQAATTSFWPPRNGYRGNQMNSSMNNAGIPSRFRPISSALLMSGNLNTYGRRPSFSSMEELRGNIFTVAKDERGCRFLKNKLRQATPDEIHLIFSELMDHVGELMVDQFGNHVVQKMLEVCNQEQITQLLLAIIQDVEKFKDVCIDACGARAVHKLLERLTTDEQKSLVTSAINRITLQLTKSMNGHHLMQYCMKCFSSEHVKPMLKIVADNCIDIAMDKSGCCFIQQCLGYAKGESFNRLINGIAPKALLLSLDPHGNYVVQFMLALNIPHVTTKVLSQLFLNFVFLSTDKFGSNVVEKCLSECNEDQVARIIEEIIHSPHFLNVIQDPFGNYVAQSIVESSRGILRSHVIREILSHYAFLHSHPHGKLVLARTKIASKFRFG